MDYSNPVNIIIAAFYYVLTSTMAFFSIFAVYILIRYGKSKAASLAIAIIYSILFLILINKSFFTLYTLK